MSSRFASSKKKLVLKLSLTMIIIILRENESPVLRRTKRAMVRAMYGAKLMEKKRTEDLMEMLELKETLVQMAKADGVR